MEIRKMKTPETENDHDFEIRMRDNLADAETPGSEVAFDPLDAEQIAFREEALSDEDARESIIDL
jgi:hypothetical protein